MSSTAQARLAAEKAEDLYRLHHGARAVLFPNVWDVAGARVLEELRYPALATTSAGIANGLGYADGENVSRSEMLEVVARIARAVRVPLTADMEGGYGRAPRDIHDTTTQVIEAGAVGMNLEDSEEEETRLFDAELQADKIRAVREAAAAAGVRFVLNARTDAYWLKKSPASYDRFAETARRAQLYRAAGADCIFVPGLRDVAEIRRLLAASPGPLNVLAGPGTPPIAELESAGVRRVSLGSGPYRAALGLLRRIGEELRGPGTVERMVEYGIPYERVNALLRP